MICNKEIELRNECKKTKCKYNYIFIFFWLIVILPKPIQLVGLTVLLLFFTKMQLEFAKDDFFRLWFVVFAIYALSIMINLIVLNHQTSRVLATLNTLIISLVALQYYSLFSRIEIDTKKIGKYALWNMLIFLCFLGIYLFISNWKNITFFGYSLSAVDTIEGANGRFVGFFAYANLVTLFSIVMLPFAIEYLNKKNKIYSFLYWILTYCFHILRVQEVDN